MSHGEFYIEFIAIGPQVKVTAIDPDSSLEVSIVAPTSATRQEMTRIVVEKLKRRIEREKAALMPEKPVKKSDTGGGILV